MQRSTIGILLFLTLLTAPVIGQEPGPAAPQDISAVVAPVLTTSGVPAIAVVALSSDGIIAQGAAGHRIRGGVEEVTLADHFHLGSCTKSMTATAAARLVEAKKLRWELTIGEVFSDLDGLHKDYRQVTLAQLLTNHGGFPSVMPPRLMIDLRQKQRTPLAARRHLLQEIASRPPATAPGGSFLYSNAGFIVAGLLMETKLQKPFLQLMQEQLFAPLRMTSAGLGAPGIPDAVDQPRGHPNQGPAIVPGPLADNPAAFSPAGRVHASIGDWARYVQMHLRGARGQKTLLSAESMRRLHEAHPDERTRYAMGWMITERPWAGGRVLTHAGSNTYWHASVWIAPEKNLAVLACSNQGGAGGQGACDTATMLIIRHLGHDVRRL